MFLLASGRYVGAHPMGSSILARGFAYLTSFYPQILEFIFWTVLILILIYFEWRDAENQQLEIKQDAWMIQKLFDLSRNLSS